jgi:outer membrane protein insertion porin family
MSSIVRIYIICALWLGIINWPGRSFAEEKKPPEVTELTFSGNNTFDADRLRQLIVTKPAGFLGSRRYYPETLADDIANLTAFYRQHGFLQAAVTDTQVVIDSVENKARIHLKIEEGKQTRLEAMDVFGNSAYDDSTLLALVDLKPGDPFSSRAIENGMLSMLSLYANNGYLDASINPDARINDAARLAVVDFMVKERNRYHIGRINVAGNKRTNRHVITRELDFEPGQVVQYGELLKSQRRLYRTGLFQSVFVRPVPTEDTSATLKNILVEVEERTSSEFAAAVGYGTVEKVRGRLEISTINLSGSALQLGSSVYGSFIRQGVSGSFTEPWTLGTRWRTDINLAFELQQEPSYDLRRYTAKGSIGRSLSEEANITFTYRFENVDLMNVQADLDTLEIKPRVRSLAMTLARDSRDNIFDPKSGGVFEWVNELAGSFLSGNSRFFRTTLRASRFFSLDRKTVLASMLNVGWIDQLGSNEPVPLSERFYAGGPDALRGFGYQKVGPKDKDGDPLGGQVKVVLNAFELRRTIGRLLGVLFGAAAFVDAGGVWTDLQSVDLHGVRVSPGVGLRVSTPIGILRLDYAVNVDKRPGESRDKFYFSMGHTF